MCLLSPKTAELRGCRLVVEKFPMPRPCLSDSRAISPPGRRWRRGRRDAEFGERLAGRGIARGGTVRHRQVGRLTIPKIVAATAIINSTAARPIKPTFTRCIVWIESRTIIFMCGINVTQ
jgi:hypothetical protein